MPYIYIYIYIYIIYIYVYVCVCASASMCVCVYLASLIWCPYSGVLLIQPQDGRVHIFTMCKI